MSHRSIALLLGLVLLAACGAPAGTPATEPTAAPATEPTAAPAATPADASTAPELVVMTHESFSMAQDVIAAFEQRERVKLVFLPAGDAGVALNKAILSKDAPIADVMFGVDNTFLSRALAAGIFETYDSPAAATIPERFRLDPSAQLTPVDYGYVTINYDKAFLQERGLTPPSDLRDLTKPEWKGLLVVENPATSSPGMAFMLATIAQFGVEGGYTWLDFWRELRANDVLVAEGWNDAYYTHFSGSSGRGPRPLVVSYATSPAAEVFFSEGKLTDAPTGNLAAGSFLQVEYVGILKGTKQRELAERFIDFMLSKPFQEAIPLQMFVYPAQPDAALPDVFIAHAPIPEAVAGLAPEAIEQNREAWLDAWTQAVLR